MPEAPVELEDLVDLKMLPAWVNEPSPGERFAKHQGEDQRETRGRGRRDGRGPKRKRPTRNAQGPQSKSDRPREGESGRDRFRGKKREYGRGRDRKDRHHHHRPRPTVVEKPLPPIAAKFLPRSAAFENVVAQIKSGPVAYSVFALARLFLEKATRHDVKLTVPAEASLFQLGENGAISVDRHFLEHKAFHFTQSDFYSIEVTETEPIKGNFTNVARDRLSGTVLGPTNHHDYQRRLRNLYEQRFSRRMSFGEYQRKIEIVSDPAVVEKWKEDARKVTTYTALREEPPQTFSSLSEAQRHFEKNYLPSLVRTVSEVMIPGPESRRLPDRVIMRLIENEWNSEMKSPSPMMQELAARFREVGLHVFRHRRGMLFVSSIYPRPLSDQQTAVSSQVRTIVDAISAQPRIGRKELADKLIIEPQKSGAAATVPVADEIERAKLGLASDLLWLISAGHVIEFNDGSLDLPRAKAKSKEKADTSVEAAVSAAKDEEAVEAGARPDESVQENSDEVGAIDPIARGRFGEPPLPENEKEISGS